MEYSYRVFLLPKTGNHANSSDLAVEFIDVNALDDEARQGIEQAVTLLKNTRDCCRTPWTDETGRCCQQSPISSGV